jgi:hypothetical protein
MAKSGSAFGGLGMAAIIGLRLFGAMSNSNAKPIQVSIGDCLSVSPTANTSKLNLVPCTTSADAGKVTVRVTSLSLRPDGSDCSQASFERKDNGVSYCVEMIR